MWYVSSTQQPLRIHTNPPHKTSIAALYCLLSIPFYWGPANVGLFVMTAIDSLLLLAFVVVAVTVGKPLSFLNCYMVKNTSATTDAVSAYNLVTSLSSRIEAGGKLNLSDWADATRANCFETKTIWGLSIALWYVRSVVAAGVSPWLTEHSILFTASMVLLPTLFYKQRKAGGPPKSAA